MEWMNQSIRLHKTYERTFDICEMYRFLSLFLLLSNCKCFSFDKPIQILNMTGHSCMGLKEVRIICFIILGYSPIGRVNCAMETWNVQRDEAQQFS